MILLGSGLTLAIHAAPITVAVGFTATGTLGGTPYTNASIVIEGIGDTDAVAPFGGAGALSISPFPASVTISGFGTATFTAAPRALILPSAHLAGFTTSGGNSILTITNAALATYDLERSIGPLSGPASISSGMAFSTSAGDFVITSAVSPATFEATVAPEPASAMLVGLAGAILVAFRRSRRGSAAEICHRG